MRTERWLRRRKTDLSLTRGNHDGHDDHDGHEENSEAFEVFVSFAVFVMNGVS